MRRSRPGTTGERHWRGGFYELALLMDGSDQGRLGDGIKALAAAAGLSGATIDTAAGPVVPDLTTAEGLLVATQHRPCRRPAVLAATRGGGQCEPDQVAGPQPGQPWTRRTRSARRPKAP